ncbi:MAG: bifunctional methylenetetrahydrofolate dehydrogenase/methenyltetrahydrofolate cyclohydrolase FolD [Planctomycetota bacterium]
MSTTPREPTPAATQTSMAIVLDGKSVATKIRAEIAEDVRQFVAKGHRPPKLAAVLVGDDPASQVYVRNKERACAKAGIISQLDRLPAETTATELLQHVASLNADQSVDGILVQLPLPSQSAGGRDDAGGDIDERLILDAIDPAKDVDAFAPANVGLLMQGRPRFLPCTPHGIVQLLHRCEIPTAGKHVVVVGRSDIVGKPMAMMLAQKTGSCGPETANATVTLAHSQSTDLANICRQADILIAAVGRPEMIRGDMIRPGAVVIDVGINRVDDRLVGDVAFDEATSVASAITPVPGGVGPLTIAMLLHNTLLAAKQAAQAPVG